MQSTCSDVMDALAAELLSYRGIAAGATAEQAAGRAGKAEAKGKLEEADEDEQCAAMGIPFVRIDGSHDSAQVRAFPVFALSQE